MASLLILCATPFYIVVGLLVYATDGRPILYKGVRLGKSGKPFIMYKFRTLPVNAEKTIGADLLSHRHQMTTPFSKLLRDTRLDELPQLFNIIKGDMDFIGPRPERPKIYEVYGKKIANYEARFAVRPGLIGYSQLFTPHSTPKRIRALIDNKYVRLKRNIVWEIGVIFCTIGVVLRATVIKGFDFFWRFLIKSKLLNSYAERRRLERVKSEDSRLCLQVFSNGNEACLGDFHLVDINEEYFHMYADTELYDSAIRLYRLETRTRKLGKKKCKHAVCMGEVYKQYALDDSKYKYAYVVKFRPVSPLNQYIIDQYFLHKSII